MVESTDIHKAQARICKDRLESQEEGVKCYHRGENGTLAPGRCWVPLNSHDLQISTQGLSDLLLQDRLVLEESLCFSLRLSGVKCGN